jgi:integrase
MATIRKYRWATARGEAREAWQVDFRDQDGRRRHKQFRLKKDADAYLVKTRNQVAEGTYTPESTSPTIREAANAWVERARADDLERSTIADYEWRRTHLMALIDPETKLARLTQARCEQLRDDLMKAHGRTRARKILQGFRSILKGAKRRGMVAQNVAADTTIGAGKRHKRRLEVGRDIPAPAEIKSMIDAASGKALAMVCLAAFAGLRASEIRGLRWTDLKLGSEPAVTISQRADRWSEIGSPKSEAARRTVPLDETAAQALRTWKLAQPPVSYRENGEKRPRPPTLVFGTATDKPDTPSNLQQRLLDPLQVRAGITSGVKVDAAGKPVLDEDGNPIPLTKYSWHALRHYAISSWLAAKLNHKLCQRWAGHRTLVLTLDTYGHFIPRRDGHEMMRTLERDLFG